MPSRFKERYASTTFKGNLTAQVWDRVLADLDARVAQNEEGRADLDAALEVLRGVALDHINSVLAPAIDSVLRLTAAGFLMADSATATAVHPGDLITWIIPEGDQRDLFTPSPFVDLTRAGDPDWYAVLDTISYDAEHGEYRGQVLAVHGAAGPFADWTLSATPGASMAMRAILEAAQAILVDAEEARDQAEEDAIFADGRATSSEQSRANSQGAATASGNARDKAQQWATNPENVPVEPGFYSSMHWAIKAAASAVAAALFDPANYYTKTQTRSSAQITSEIAAAIAALVGGAPGALDALGELAAALGNDANFATTVTNALALKAPLDSPSLTGNPTAPTPPPGDADASLATTEFTAIAAGDRHFCRNFF